MKHRYLQIILFVVAMALAAPRGAAAQDRDAKVRNDRQLIESIGGWIYNDLDAGIRRARAEGKPILVVFRCIPCEACHEFDDDVARRNPAVRDLMDRFVCVRIVRMNDADLTRFQHDFDQSFAITLMHPDGTIYGRFGTRSNRDDESVDISLEGLREALDGALRMHARHGEYQPRLEGKRVKSARFATPLDYPSLKGEYKPTLDDSEGRVAQSCVHCHQVGEAERRFFRDQGEPVPDTVLFPYPHPTVLGLAMDPKHAATVKAVAPGSPAERDGFRAGDRIVSLEGQPLLSIADIQWVLHQAPESGALRAEVERNGAPVALTLTLDEGWRQRGDLSWRATTWDLRRMALGGMQLEPLPDDERRSLGLADGKTALRARHVGEYGEHATALNAGVRKGDIIVAFDGRDNLPTETALLAYALQNKRPGDEVVVALLRDGRRREVRFALQ